MVGISYDINERCVNLGILEAGWMDKDNLRWRALRIVSSQPVQCHTIAYRGGRL